MSGRGVLPSASAGVIDLCSDSEEDSITMPVLKRERSTHRNMVVDIDGDDDDVSRDVRLRAVRIHEG